MPEAELQLNPETHLLRNPVVTALLHLQDSQSSHPPHLLFVSVDSPIMPCLPGPAFPSMPGPYCCSSEPPSLPSTRLPLTPNLDANPIPQWVLHPPLLLLYLSTRKNDEERRKQNKS